MPDVPSLGPGVSPKELAAPAAQTLRQIALLAGVVGILLAVAYFSPLREYVGRWQEASRAIRSVGLWAPLFYTMGVTVVVALGFPRLLLCVVGGATFGAWWGLLWTQLGSLAGTYVVFLFARANGDWARHLVESRVRLREYVRREGVAGVVLARQLPLPSIVINIACGLLAISHRDFIFGTVLGQLPEAIPCTLIGAGLLKASFAESLGVLSLAVVAAVLLYWLLRRWLSATPR